jgi:hypothetical protein
LSPIPNDFWAWDRRVEHGVGERAGGLTLAEPHLQGGELGRVDDRLHRVGADRTAAGVVDVVVVVAAHERSAPGDVGESESHGVCSSY